MSEHTEQWVISLPLFSDDHLKDLIMQGAAFSGGYIQPLTDVISIMIHQLQTASEGSSRLQRFMHSMLISIEVSSSLRQPASQR